MAQGLTLDRLYNLIQGSTSESSSYATTASYAITTAGELENAVSASYAVTASHVTTVPTPVSASYAVTASYAANGGVGGSGVANYLPKFTAATTLSSSVVQESAGNIGIGLSPSYKLDVSGSATIIARFKTSDANCYLNLVNSSGTGEISSGYNGGIFIGGSGAGAIYFRNSSYTNRFVIGVSGEQTAYLSDQYMFLSGSSDVDVGSFSGILRIGANGGAHIAIDANEIMAKSSNTAATILYLNHQGGSVHIGQATANSQFYVSASTWKIGSPVVGIDATGAGITNYVNTAEHIFYSGSTTVFKMDGDSNYNLSGLRIIPATNNVLDLGLGGTEGTLHWRDLWLSRYITGSQYKLSVADSKALSGSSAGWSVDYGTTNKPLIASAIVTQSAAPAGASSYPFGTLWGQYT